MAHTLLAVALMKRKSSPPTHARNSDKRLHSPGNAPGTRLQSGCNSRGSQSDPQGEQACRMARVQETTKLRPDTGTDPETTKTNDRHATSPESSQIPIVSLVLQQSKISDSNRSTCTNASNCCIWFVSLVFVCSCAPLCFFPDVIQSWIQLH